MGKKNSATLIAPQTEISEFALSPANETRCIGGSEWYHLETEVESIPLDRANRRVWRSFLARQNQTHRNR